MNDAVNADFSRRAVVHSAAARWQPSPSESVWRKRLDLAGPSEASRVTSVVRYDADSAFPSHPHPDGEEILVLDGVFSDQHGDYPAGTYLLNPEGFFHAPFSKAGCVLFVKLRQYPGAGRRQVIVDTNTGPWRPGSAPGITALPLYAEKGFPETMRLVRFAAGAQSPFHGHPGGEEVFVLDGDLHDGFGDYTAGSWVRMPAGSSHQARSDGGCTLYVKAGHLAGA